MKNAQSEVKIQKKKNESEIQNNIIIVYDER